MLATLHDELPLSRVIARFKAKSRPALAAADLEWQGNYYEHRLREEDAIDAVLMYIFLNPYRAGLIPASETYPLFWLGAQESTWFKHRLNEEKPLPEWLR